MLSLRGRASCALAVAISVAATATAQQLPDLPSEARIKVRIIPLERGRAREAVAYVKRLDADSLHFRFGGTAEVTVVPWARVRTLKVSDGQRTTPLGVHVLHLGGATALGALFGYGAWHSCRDARENEITFDCIISPRRLGASTNGGAAIAAGIALVYSFTHLKEERWRDVAPPGAVRVSVRRAGGGVGVGVALAF